MPAVLAVMLRVRSMALMLARMTRPAASALPMMPQLTQLMAPLSALVLGVTVRIVMAMPRALLATHMLMLVAAMMRALKMMAVGATEDATDDGFEPGLSGSAYDQHIVGRP